MVLIKKVIKFLFSIYGFAVFIALMFLLFPFILLASFAGKVRGGNIIYRICRLWADIAFACWGITHKNIYEAAVTRDHPVIYVFNHTSYMDIPVLMKAFRPQAIRVLGKAEMAAVPVFGFIYKEATVMVDRKSDEGRAQSVRELKEVLAKNISVVIAPEGTFNMTGKPLKEFYNGAFNIAVETNTPVQPVLFLDAFDRLSYKSIFSLTPGRSRAVFLPGIMPGKDPLELKQKVYREMENALIRYKASWINDTGK